MLMRPNSISTDKERFESCYTPSHTFYIRYIEVPEWIVECYEDKYTDVYSDFDYEEVNAGDEWYRNYEKMAAQVVLKI